MTYPNRERALRQLDRNQQRAWNPGGIVAPVVTPLGPLDLTALNETVARQQEGARTALTAMSRTLAPFLESLRNIGL